MWTHAELGNATSTVSPAPVNSTWPPACMRVQSCSPSCNSPAHQPSQSSSVSRVRRVPCGGSGFASQSSAAMPGVARSSCRVEGSVHGW
eukprot:11771861-Prorocentrum_lima.AAC.1